MAEKHDGSTHDCAACGCPEYARPTLFAYLESAPRLAPKQRVKLSDEVRWMAESWSSARTLGAAKSHPYKMYSTGPVPKYLSQNPHDIRAVPAEAVARLAEMDAEIARLTSERAEWLKDQFRTWPLVKEKDCAQTFSGRSKADVVAEIRKQTPRSKAAVKREANVVRGINRAIGDTFLSS